MTRARIEAWTTQIDEGPDESIGETRSLLSNLTLEVLLKMTASIDEVPPGLEHVIGSDHPVSTFPVEYTREHRHPPARRVGTQRMRMGRGITVDSGAADNVMPRRMVRGKFNKIRPSPGQKAGVRYLAANNARIANEGEAEFNFQTAEGDDEAWVFQIAAVNKVLCAVSYLMDHGMRVIFDKDEKTGVDTSHVMNKKTGKSIKMIRSRNVWTIEAFIDEDETMASFPRQG